VAKDKLLTIPIESAKRDALNQYCQSRGIKVSELITAYIDKCLSGIIDIENPIDNSIDTGNSIDVHIAIEEAIDNIKPELLDIVSAPLNNVYTKLKEHDDDIHELENALYSWQTMLKTLTELVNKQGIAKIELDPTTKQALAHTIKPEQPYKTHSSDEMYLSGEPTTVEDTREFIDRIYKTNLEFDKVSDRVSQEEIAKLLSNHKYPHPNGKKWNRDEVRRVCKLWDIVTK
jgi:hypothetical protein